MSRDGTGDLLRVTRQERIRFLLEHLEDVRAGVRDRGSESGEHLPLMCRAWNTPSYRELERLLSLLRKTRPDLAWHLSGTFFARRRRVNVCPRCLGQTAAWSSINFHKHGGKNVALAPRVLRVVSNQCGRKSSRPRSSGWTSAGEAACLCRTSCCRSFRRREPCPIHAPNGHRRPVQPLAWLLGSSHPNPSNGAVWQAVRRRLCSSVADPGTALQAGGRRFDPGTLHWKKRWK